MRTINILLLILLYIWSFALLENPFQVQSSLILNQDFNFQVDLLGGVRYEKNEFHSLSKLCLVRYNEWKTFHKTVTFFLFIIHTITYY